MTVEQQRIVEWGDGPLVVIAGAGTGKTRVIIERIRWLMESKGAGNRDGRSGPGPANLAALFNGPLLPEQVLVLTYNVKAARELSERLNDAVGPAIRARMSVSNFHSFCHRILTESAGDAGLPARPDVLDGVDQVLLLRDIRDQLPLVYHSDWWLGQFVGFINRAKDELVTPARFEAFVSGERLAFEAAHGPYEPVAAELEARALVRGQRDVRAAYASRRRHERAEAAGRDAGPYDAEADRKAADREARRVVGGTGYAVSRGQIPAELHDQVDELAATYVRDGAALEVMRLGELAAVYRAYQAELARRGALDFGEQIAAVTTLFKARPNVLRRWQRQFRYILVDEFQDANVAQIELVELIGRTPDRPDNVMVVGDDDQSIYRFRGASFAAFAEFDARFSGAPAHDPSAVAPGPPARLRIEQNFRSVDRILTAANRLIARNGTRFEPDKRLRTERVPGEPVDLLICAGPEDEAVAVVDAVRALVDPERARAEHRRPAWSEVAILYRMHRHRDAIVARLRDEDIPHTVVGGLSLFEAPEIRDLEQSLRAIADPHDDVAFTRMMTAGPWRLDALEILDVSRTASFAKRHLVDVVRDVVASGELAVDRPSPSADGGAAPLPRGTVPVAPETRARLRRMVGVLEELAPLTWREGPFTIAQRFLERSGQLLDLIAVDTLEAHRMVANIASFLRFASDWQGGSPSGTLAGFVAYLDAYRDAGGELPTSVELTEDVDGVRLMTLYQAKGLEFPAVFVPGLLEGEWPAREWGGGLFPQELLREAIPGGDLHTDEERRLLYVAMTRARDRLTLTTHAGPSAKRSPSPFVAELVDGAGDELRVTDRTSDGAAGSTPAAARNGVPEDGDGALDEADDPLLRTSTLVRRVMPLPTRRERRLAIRLRATELVGLLEGTSPDDPEAASARERLAADLARTGLAASDAADTARAQGLDPLSLRGLALDSGAGSSLLQVAPLPRSFSYTQFSTYERCPLQYAFSNVYGIPTDRTVGAFTFGTTAHETFEAFTKERRERLARGDPAPTRDDLERLFRDRWTPSGFGDGATAERYARRVDTLLDNFWDGEVRTVATAMHEELWFDLTLDPGDGSPPVVVSGSIDRIDRLPTGGVEVVDYKTGRQGTQKSVDESLQLSIYALACRDLLGLGTPELVTLYYTESATRMSTTRTDEQLDAARADILARAALIRSGDFAATPSERACRYCDYAAMCPGRVQ